MRRHTKMDAGLQQIDEWHDWFIGAHRQRLRENGLSPADVEREMVPIVAQAEAISAKRREDYLTWQRRIP